MRVYFNPNDGEFVIAAKKPSNQFRTLTKLIGIYWNDDQSCNQIAISWHRSRWPDYTFDPIDDIDLVRQYTDQLIDLFS